MAKKVKKSTKSRKTKKINHGEDHPGYIYAAMVGIVAAVGLLVLLMQPAAMKAPTAYNWETTLGAAQKTAPMNKPPVSDDDFRNLLAQEHVETVLTTMTMDECAAKGLDWWWQAPNYCYKVTS